MPVSSVSSVAGAFAPVRARFGLGAIVLIVVRSLRHHALSSSVTAFAVALACGLVMSVFAIQKQANDAFTGGPVGFDAVLGARGSQLQLVLNTVFHLETSPGNIPWRLYRQISSHPLVALAIPYALGDNYRGFRIVGVTPELFTDFEYQAGRRFTVAPGGRIFDPALREAVVGSVAAQRTGLRVGDIFQPYHGLSYQAGGEPHREEYVVVGVLEPTNSPSDRVIWIPIEGVFRMEGHVLRGTGADYRPEAEVEIPDQHKEVSAVMLKFRTAQAGPTLNQDINRQGNVATLAWPIGAVMADLFERLGWVNRILELVAYLVVLVSAAAILAAIYNTINERRREFAILRALGARRSAVFSAIVLESSLIAFCGALLGFGVYLAIMSAAAIVIRQTTGVVIDIFALHFPMLWTPLAMIAAGALVGLVPAWKAYRTDVAENLSPSV